MKEDILSKDESVRLRALLLFGLSEQQTHDFTNDPQAGRQVIQPDLVKLDHAALGDGPEIQAILSFQAGQETFVAVARTIKSGWVRIASNSIWSKYDVETGDALFENVRLSVVPGNQAHPEKFELILRSSGGGSGLYHQQEAHYRLYKGELRNVFSFESARRSCPDSPDRTFKCDVTRSWFAAAALINGGKDGRVLVEERGIFPSVKQPPITFYIRELEIRYLHLSKCSFYTWDDVSFSYKLISTSPEACRTPKSQ